MIVSDCIACMGDLGKGPLQLCGKASFLALLWGRQNLAPSFLTEIPQHSGLAWKEGWAMPDRPWVFPLNAHSSCARKSDAAHRYMLYTYRDWTPPDLEFKVLGLKLINISFHLWDVFQRPVQADHSVLRLLQISQQHIESQLEPGQKSSWRVASSFSRSLADHNS